MESKLPDLSPRQSVAVFLVAGLVAGAGATYLALNYDNVSKRAAGQKVVETLEAQTGNDFSLLNVETEAGLYKVNIRSANDQVSTFYVTRDGQMVASSVSDLDRLRRLALARTNLATCMQQRDVVMFGNASQPETVAQIQLLGGQRYVSSIYADIRRNRTLQQAVQVGVQRIPAFYYNGSLVQGIQTPQSLSNFTGCGYGAAR